MDANSILQSYNKATGSSSTPQYKPTGKPKVDSILSSYYSASAKTKAKPTVTPAPKKVATTPVKKVAAAPIVKQAPQTGVQKALKTLGDVSQQAQNVVKTIGKGIEVTFVKPKVISPVPEKVIQQKKQQAQGPVQIKPGQTKLTKTQMSGFAQMTNNITSQIPATIKSAKEYVKDPLNIGKLNNKGQAESRKAAAEGFNDIKSAFIEAVNRSAKAKFQKAPLKEKAIQTVESWTGVVNMLFSPISAGFKVADTIPIVSVATRVVSLGFGAIGEGVPKLTNSAIDGIPNQLLSKKDKERVKPVIAEATTIIAMLAAGHLTKVGGEKLKSTIKTVGLENFERATKNVIETTNSPKTINLTKDQVRDIYRDLGDKEALDVFKKLEVADRVKAVKEGLTIDIPAEKVVRLVDKPYWEKIKKILGKEPTNIEIGTKGEGTGRVGFAGYLTDGQHTPQEVVGAVIKAGEENTVEGKATIKAALEAQKSGHNIELKQVEEKPVVAEVPKVEQKIPQIERAKDYTSAKDFADEVYSAQPGNQIGLVDPKTITIRDNVDPTSPEYKKLYEDIKANGIKKPVRLTVDGEALTTDGSNRTHIGRALGIKVPVIVNKGEIKGLKTIEEHYAEQGPQKSALEHSAEAKAGLKKAMEPAESQEDSVKLAEEYIQPRIDRLEKNYNLNELKGLRAAINREMYNIAGVDPRNGKSEIKIFDEAFNNPEMSDILDKLDSYVKKIDTILDSKGEQASNKKQAKITTDNKVKELSAAEKYVQSKEAKLRVDTRQQIAPKSPDEIKIARFEFNAKWDKQTEKWVVPDDQVAAWQEDLKIIRKNNLTYGQYTNRQASLLDPLQPLSDALDKVVNRLEGDLNTRESIESLQSNMKSMSLNLFINKLKVIIDNMEGNRFASEGLIDILLKAQESVKKQLATKEQPLLESRVPKLRVATDMNRARLTTKILNDLEGRTTVSKQFIQDATNRGDITQGERDLIRDILRDFPDKIDVPKFVERVQAELLPLTTKETGSVAFQNRQGNGDRLRPRYESVALPASIRGPVADYVERIYESPIKTSAGDVHFSGETDNYFAHTRIEDLPLDSSNAKYKEQPSSLDTLGTYIAKDGSIQRFDSKGTTRRVIEIQSDLMQKGRLERELNVTPKDYPLSPITPAKEGTKRYEEIAKLQPFTNDRFIPRIAREEIAQAAQDGKTKLQFPTGETAMKIEGLGQENSAWLWNEVRPNGETSSITTTIENLKVGKELDRGGSRWIITDVLGDGKFKAVPKEKYVLHQEMIERGQASKSVLSYYEALKETFDISAKVDTSHGTYRKYAKVLGPYLQRAYNAKVITDARGVTWYEVDITPDMGREVLAFRIRDDLAKKGIKITLAQQTEIEALNKRIFGDTDVKIVGQIIANYEALGKYEKGMIEILDGKADAKDTFMHEAVHKYLDVFTDQADHVAILEEGAKKYGIDDYAQVEERIAEDFISYAKTKQGFVGRLKELIDQLIRHIKTYFGNKSKIDEMYREIIEKGKTRPGEREVQVNRDQIPIGEGETRATRLEARVQDIKGNLEKVSQETIDKMKLSTYEQLNNKEQIRKAVEWADQHREEAIQVLTGEIPAPPGILRNAIYVAMQNEAIGDVALARKLASLQSTRYGQEIQVLSEIDPDSPVKIMTDIVRIREEQFKKKYGDRKPSQVREKIVKDIKDKVKTPDKYDWNAFINSIDTC